MVLIECPSQKFMVFEHQLFNSSQIVRSDSPISSETYRWRQPELTLTVWRPNVDVWWLLSFI